MGIYARQHCIPCYDFLRRLERVDTIPSNFSDMEEKTAAGIIKKCKAIIDSDWFINTVADFKTIKSRADENYTWDKNKEMQEIVTVYNETKNYLDAKT